MKTDQEQDESLKLLLRELIEDLCEFSSRLNTIENSLKFQVLNNTDSMEAIVRSRLSESIRLSKRLSELDSDFSENGSHDPERDRELVNEMIKGPVRRQIGSVKTIRLAVDSFIKRLRLHTKKGNENGSPDSGGK